MITKYDSLFKWYGAVYKIPAPLLKAQAYAESGLDPNAQSHAGAKGLTQFMDPTWHEWAEHKLHIPRASVWNPDHAIHTQAAYMAWLLAQVGGDTELALAAYVWGIGNVKRKLDQGRDLGDMPGEVHTYLNRIRKYRHQVQEEWL